MIVDTVLAKVFGTKTEREVKALQPIIAAINELEPGLRELSDIDLAAKTIEFKERIARAPPSTTCSSRHSPWSAKPDAASSTCAISMCR